MRSGATIVELIIAIVVAWFVIDWIRAQRGGPKLPPPK
jgi:hypothetical protein